MKKKLTPCSTDIQWPAGARIYLSVDSAELGLDDYNVRISTQGTLLDYVLKCDNVVLATLDEIDGDHNVTLWVPKNKVRLVHN